MIEQVSNTIRYVCFYAKNGAGVTGLTVTFDAWDPSGSQVVTAQAATEIGGGFYRYDYAAGATPGLYPGKFTTAGDVDQAQLPSLWAMGVAGVENLDAAISSRLASASYTTPPTAAAVADQVWDEAMAGHVAGGSTGEKLNAAGGASDPLTNTVPGAYAVGSAGYALGRIGTGQVTAVQPVSGDGQVLLLTRGDDYANADGRAIELSSEAWPNLTGLTSVTLTVRSRKSDAVLFTKVGSAPVVGAGSQTVRFEPAAAETVLLEPAGLTAKFDVEVVLSTRKITIASGLVNVTEDQTRV